MSTIEVRKEIHFSFKLGDRVEISIDFDTASDEMGICHNDGSAQYLLIDRDAASALVSLLQYALTHPDVREAMDGKH